MTAYRATLQPSGQTEQTQPVRYGLIGFGGIAENRLAREGFGCDAARVAPPPNAVLTGATDINPDRRRAARALGLRWYASAADLLADPAIDAVVVATNNLTHAPLARQALEAGKPVIVEKPLAANARDAQALVRLAARRGLSLAVDHMMVYNVLNRRARALIAQGALGNVNDACFHMQFAYGYDPAEAASWRCSSRAEMGGPIGDVASHCFYMMEYLLDDQIRAVRAVYYPKRMPIAVEDGALIQCDLASGVTATVNVSFCDRRGGPGGTIGNLGYECYGDQGVLRGYGTLFQLSGYPDEPFPIRLELDTFTRQRTYRVKRPENIYQGVIRAHAASIQSGQRLSGEDGLRNVRLCELAHRSARQGGKCVNV
ncbi:MAG: Gfo/Idh/MocA family oxidoreductase [Lentisphaerae bacterium]|mgnify:CR=1 FL=1|jgi:predicted dehydrogenase|nr:Gfo/Idh/MocA family oxidoreductase [Lentisphaerota bacterium]